MNAEQEAYLRDWMPASKGFRNLSRIILSYGLCESYSEGEPGVQGEALLEEKWRYFAIYASRTGWDDLESATAFPDWYDLPVPEPPATLEDTAEGMAWGLESPFWEPS